MKGASQNVYNYKGIEGSCKVITMKGKGIVKGMLRLE